MGLGAVTRVKHQHLDAKRTDIPSNFWSLPPFHWVYHLGFLLGLDSATRLFLFLCTELPTIPLTVTYREYPTGLKMWRGCGCSGYTESLTVCLQMSNWCLSSLLVEAGYDPRKWPFDRSPLTLCQELGLSISVKPPKTTQWLCHCYKSNSDYNFVK